MNATTMPRPGFDDDGRQLSSYRGQFVLSRTAGDLPRGWQRTEASGWHLAVNDLPVHPLVRDTRLLGWCVGYPIGGALELDPDNIESFYERFGGAWALLLVGMGRLMLDAGGQIPAVYQLEPGMVASTPTLIPSAGPRDAELELAMGLPDRNGWLPFGLTSRPNVRRLTPNHYLDLDAWTVLRHWPTRQTDLTIRAQTKPLVSSICEVMTRTIQTAAARTPLSFTLTAGYDSRMVLATARSAAAEATFSTFSQAEETRDTHVARLLAHLGRLDHRLIPTVEATDAEMSAWLDRTGHAAGGDIWKIHKTLTRLEPTRALVTGMAGEVGRGYYYRKGDSATKQLTSELLLARLGRPAHARVLEAGAHWLERLRQFDLFTVLDLAYIEQRLGCWAAPQRFGNVISLFEFTPFNHRRVFTAMLQLPRGYRWRDRLPVEVIRLAWPELLRLPFNRYTEGWRGFRDNLTSVGKAVLGSVRYRGGEL